MATDGDRPEANISEPEGRHGGHGEFVLAGPTHMTGLFAFVFTWLLFSNIFDPKIPEPTDNVSAAQRNEAPLNERLGRISSDDPKAEVQQPRLEGLDKRQTYARDGDPKNAEGRNLITAEMTVTQPTKDGNSPRYHAEDLRPGKSPALTAGGTNPQGGAKRLPVDEAMKLLVDGKLLAAQEGARRLDVDPDWDRPKESNGGWAKPPTPAKPAAAKKDEKNGPEKKGGEPEKKGGEPEKK
jgi:hypothetical protein